MCPKAVRLGASVPGAGGELALAKNKPAGVVRKGAGLRKQLPRAEPGLADARSRGLAAKRVRSLGKWDREGPYARIAHAQDQGAVGRSQDTGGADLDSQQQCKGPLRQETQTYPGKRDPECKNEAGTGGQAESVQTAIPRTQRAD